jgi:hypothetical protein
MNIFIVFYMVGGAIGVLINLRFLIPTAYYDLKNAWGFLGAVKTIGYHFVRIIVLSCVCFFVSWASVGYFVLHYDDFKDELYNTKL